MVEIQIVLAIGIISVIAILFLARRQSIVAQTEESGTPIQPLDAIIIAFSLVLFMNVVSSAARG